MLMKTEEKLMKKDVSQEQIEISMTFLQKSIKIVDSVIANIFRGIGFGGFVFFQRGNKDSQLSNTFKFDRIRKSFWTFLFQFSLKLFLFKKSITMVLHYTK
jgi:hypothetical protein